MSFRFFLNIALYWFAVAMSESQDQRHRNFNDALDLAPGKKLANHYCNVAATGPPRPYNFFPHVYDLVKSSRG